METSHRSSKLVKSLLRYDNLSFFQDGSYQPYWLVGFILEPRRVIKGIYHLSKFDWNPLSWLFCNVKVWIFCTFGFKTSIHAPKIEVLGRSNPLDTKQYQRNLQKAHPCMERCRITYRMSISVHWCDRCMWLRNKTRKTRILTVANWVFARPHTVGSRYSLALARWMIFT